MIFAVECYNSRENEQGTIQLLYNIDIFHKHRWVKEDIHKTAHTVWIYICRKIEKNNLSC